MNNASRPEPRWDHIVVGAGSAGAIVASKLSEDPNSRVLLLEAGGSADQSRFRIPALAMKAYGDPDCDWLLATEADPSRLGKTEVWYRGKVLGGSSSINGTIYVRGNRGDYDHWKQLGNVGWGYDSLLTYFRRQESGVRDIAKTYGTDGPIHICEPKGIPKLARVFIEAMRELGVPSNPNYNGTEQTGAAVVHVNQHRGVRESTAHAYLRPAINRRNLSVLTRATARRILFEGTRAVGIEFEHGGAIRQEISAHDIVLSASVINTPKLLMLSGVGDPADLKAHGITVLYANPAVGRNLQEHPSVPIKAYVNTHTTNMDFTPLGQAKIALQYMLTRGGPATFAWSAIAFVKSKAALEYPDLQFHFGTFATDKITSEGVKWVDRPAVSMLVNVNRSSANGFVKLGSADPISPAFIQPNMLANQEEVNLLKQGVSLGRNVWRTKAFAPYFQRELAPDKSVDVDDAALEAFVRREANTSYHACGTAKMGVGEHAVVDPRLRVRGVGNLRVVDCSIIPQVPSGNINAISMVIGQKGADMIKEDLT
jgi:choline dehydrogenase